MNKLDVAQLLKTICMYYPNFKIEDVDKTTNAWLLVLQNDDASVVGKNLANHVRTEKFPPTIADLLKIPVVDKYENGRRAIPNAEQTKLMLESYENKTPATREKINEVSEKVWEILENIRIERGESK